MKVEKLVENSLDSGSRGFDLTLHDDALEALGGAALLPHL